MPRCPNGSRKDKKTGECKKVTTQKRCPNGTRRNKKSGNCEHVRKAHHKSKSLSFKTALRSHKSMSYKTARSKSKSRSKSRRKHSSPLFSLNL